MPVTMIDAGKYGQLLATAQPAIVRTDSEHDRLAEILMRLTIPPRELSPEEERLAELLGHLVDEYEQRQRETEGRAGKPAPRELLASIMEFGELRQADLVDVFGSQGNVSEVLSGKRNINLQHAKRLSERFRIPVEKFL